MIGPEFTRERIGDTKPISRWQSLWWDIEYYSPMLAVILFGIALVLFMISFAFGHQELRNDMPVVPNALTFCFMRYDSKDSGERDTYLECNMVEGFTQEQLKTMREHLEDLAQK